MRAVFERRHPRIVDQSEIDDVDRNFRVVTGPERLVYAPFQVGRVAGALFVFGRQLLAERVGVVAGNSEKTAV